MTDIKAQIGGLLDEFVAGITRRHIALGQKVTGKTIASLERQLFDNGGLNFTAQLLGRPYFGVLDKGAGPAKRRGTDEERAEFIRSLTEWCRIRGFPSGGLTEAQYLRTAKWLKWRINKFGTRMHNNPSMQDKVITPEIAIFEDKLEKALNVWFDDEIDNRFFKKG